MGDVWALAGTGALFALAGLFLKGCARLVDSPASDDSTTGATK